MKKRQYESQKKHPLVSIVMATYRRQEDLKRAMDSLLSQTYDNLELILVDDNGKKVWNRRVEALVEMWKQTSGIPIVYIQNEKSLGSAETRNRGIRATSGEYITFLDDDDRYIPEKVEHQLEDMVRTGADYSITDLELYNEKGVLEERRIRFYLQGLKAPTVKELFAFHLMYHMTGTDTLMFRRDYLLKIGGFPPINVGDEFYLMKEAILGGGVFTYLPECGVRALVHSRTKGLSSRAGKIAGECALYEYKKQYFDQLKPFQRRRITMRHHMVLSYAYLRSGAYGRFVWEGILSFISSPVSCLAMGYHYLISRKGNGHVG